MPDFEKNKPPDYRPPEGAVGVEALRGDDPFVMQADGKAWLFAPNGLLDGPLPTHYEPQESPVRNALYKQQGNPARKVYGRADNPSNPSPPEPHGEVFPFVFTAARLTEHHTAGGMSRQLPYLSELQPALFVEVSPELAAERGLTHLDWAHVVTSRTAVEARVFVTDRMRPLRVEDRVVHQVWMPYHWGNVGLVDGDVVNDLLGVVADPNVFIQESKVATCDIQPGRRPRGPALLEYIATYRDRAGITHRDGYATSTPRRLDGPHAATPEETSGRERTTASTGRWTIRRATPGTTDHPPRVGFFTDTSVCIGCKACEVACKEWNEVPDDGFNLLGHVVRQHGQLGANSWRHVAFIEQPRAAQPVDLGMPSFERPGDGAGAETRTDFRWLMSSDVCKHCTHAGCLDVCPTGALFRTEFGTVVVQQDICNGCGYCVRAARTG